MRFSSSSVAFAFVACALFACVCAHNGIDHSNHYTVNVYTNTTVCDNTPSFTAMQEKGSCYENLNRYYIISAVAGAPATRLKVCWYRTSDCAGGANDCLEYNSADCVPTSVNSFQFTAMTDSASSVVLSSFVLAGVALVLALF